MKSSTVFIMVFCVLFIIWRIAIYIHETEQLALQKPYSVTIVHGTPMINYSAILQVDSLKYISKESMIVYLNGSSLWIKADFITFKRN